MTSTSHLTQNKEQEEINSFIEDQKCLDGAGNGQ